jgi:hypothetical protein
MSTDSDSSREALFILFGQVGFHDGQQLPVVVDRFRIRCSACDHFIVLADAAVDVSAETTIYRCPCDRSELALVKGKELFDLYGDTEVQRDGTWHRWDIHESGPTGRTE